MSLLLSAQGLTKSFGPRPLFVDISFDIHSGDRIGLIGPNGSGKSTLLKILAGLEPTDLGQRSLRKTARLGFVAQQDEFPADDTVEQVVCAALAEQSSSERHIEPHELHTLAAVALGKVGFTDRSLRAGTLSGGWRKRLALARQLALAPDVLLLDEPTNHLDLAGILWLEKLLAAAPFAFLLVSHDRWFLEQVTQRVVELNRVYPKGYFSSAGAYSDFLAARETFLAGQQQQQSVLQNKVNREIEWLKRGPKARTTKSVGRINEAGKLMDELGEVSYRNSQRRTVDIDFSSTGRRANRLLQAKGLGKQMAGRTLFENVELTLEPGTKVGLLGPNGSGKSTLLRMLSGQEPPEQGKLEQPRDLRVILFDQHREQLAEDETLRRALAHNEDHVMYQDRKTHVVAWAKRFLFTAEQLDVPVSSLSGGEQARILIARLMTQPADVLLLDEPTNDLDIPSLEVLEESLTEFGGALVLVTHDRYLLDRVCNVILALDGDGAARVYADLAQWEAAQRERSGASAADEGATAGGAKPPKAGKGPRGDKSGSDSGKAKKLSYREQKELDGIETSIHSAEAQRDALQQQLAEPDVSADHLRMRACCEQLETAQATIDELYARWQELEEKRCAAQN